ncbi:hypothetical protein BZARG_2042 [Bizionia argentinensis JUB59]|uniref:Uncharacterized protein n=1 Tax=Bizionia argentinensis JUB59 TaxID=1046627 RepID=G2EFA8_9FLAO|nr:hypothetical protein [Bizionia argentinensis]EGV42920.1 hypothetical protein BZARG_2042 [Bizionia argentinensis JUB59]
MKKDEVPQDTSNLETAKMKELCYAVDENGSYTTVNSSGWKPKTIALSQAIEEINERIEAARKRVLNNETSPIEYYMEYHKMDPSILASYVNMWSCQVKRNFKPSIFKRLPRKTLQKYADAFDISLEQLKDITKHGN